MKKKKKPDSVDGVVELEGEIRRTNRFFVALKSYGQCDAKGKTVLGIGCSGKLTAPPDRPLLTMTCILEDLIPAMGYSSKEAMESDLKEFQEFVAKRDCDWV